MDNIFKNKGKSRISTASISSNGTAAISSPTSLTTAVPYDHLPNSHPPPVPVAGPSTSTISLVGRSRDVPITVQDIGAPSSNPGLGDGTMFNFTSPRRQDSALPPLPLNQPSPHKQLPMRSSSRQSRSSARSSIDTVRSGPAPGFLQDVMASGGLPMPTITMNSAPPEARGQPPHPYAASAHDPDTMSIRSAASSRQDLGRYPSFSSTNSGPGRSMPPPRAPLTPSRASYAPSVISLNSVAETQGSDGFHLPRPPNGDIEAMFQELLQNRGMDIAGASISSRTSIDSLASVQRSAASLPIDTKWQMVEADARARWETSTSRAGKRTTTAASKNSPEWFLKKILDGSVNAAHLGMLDVSLRSATLDWFATFMACQGQVVLANYLSNLHTRKARGGADYELEKNLLMCLKRCLNYKVSKVVMMEADHRSPAPRTLWRNLKCSRQSPVP